MVDDQSIGREFILHGPCIFPPPARGFGKAEEPYIDNTDENKGFNSDKDITTFHYYDVLQLDPIVEGR